MLFLNLDVGDLVALYPHSGFWEGGVLRVVRRKLFPISELEHVQRGRLIKTIYVSVEKFLGKLEI